MPLNCRVIVARYARVIIQRKKRKTRAYKAARDRKQSKRQIAAKKKRTIPCGKRPRSSMTLNIIASSGNIHPVCKLMRHLANASRSLLFVWKKKSHHSTYFLCAGTVFARFALYIRDARLDYVII